MILAPIMSPFGNTWKLLSLLRNVPPIIVPPCNSPTFCVMADKLSTCILSAVTAPACIMPLVMTFWSNTASLVTCSSLPSILVPVGDKLIREISSLPSRLLIRKSTLLDNCVIRVDVPVTSDFTTPTSPSILAIALSISAKPNASRLSSDLSISTRTVADCSSLFGPSPKISV